MEETSSALSVRFYQKALENKFRTQAEGRPVSDMRDFVVIEIPGNQTLRIDTLANDGHKQRFPIEWARYQNEKSDADVSGTLLKDWPLLNAAQAAELKHYKFYTVEQVAEASDQQINSIGMLIGMAPSAFRDKAKAFLNTAKDSVIAAAQAEELAALRAQIEELKRETPKRGRPAKQEAEAA